MAEHINRGASCKDCFYNIHCPGLNTLRKERDDTDAERCKAYTEGNPICVCCKSCQRVIQEGGKRFCGGKGGKLTRICDGWHDPEHFKKG